jgi:hypothetical protein
MSVYGSIHMLGTTFGVRVIPERAELVITSADSLGDVRITINGLTLPANVNDFADALENAARELRARFGEPELVEIPEAEVRALFGDR